MVAEPPALSPPAPGAAPVTQRFKVVSDGLSATISLEAKWLAKPFAQAVVQTVVLKLNKRPNVEPVAVESLEGIEIDGEQVALPGASTTVAEVVPPMAQLVRLTFGETPPHQMRFVVHAGTIEITITLDAKFMRKSFTEAVVKPFVTMYNKRSALPVTADECVAVLVDDDEVKYRYEVKDRPGSYHVEAAVNVKSAYQFLGRYPSHVELFFSAEAVAARTKPRSTHERPHEALRYKVRLDCILIAIDCS
jgi:hypothetical protein